LLSPPSYPKAKAECVKPAGIQSQTPLQNFKI